MNDDIIFKVVGYNFIVILFLLVLKTVLFFTAKSKRRTFKKFLFYSETNLYGTKDPKRKRQKNIQNILSTIIFALLLLQVVLVLLTAFYRRKIEE